MKCPECNGLRYREYESGLIRVPCGVCDGMGEVGKEPPLSCVTEFPQMGGGGTIIGTIEELPEGWVDKGECIGGFLDDSSSGTESDNQHTGSTDTSQPAKPKKPKAKKKARG